MEEQCRVYYATSRLILVFRSCEQSFFLTSVPPLCLFLNSGLYLWLLKGISQGCLLCLKLCVYAAPVCSAGLDHL